MLHKKQAYHLIQEIVHQNEKVWNNPRGEFDIALEYDMLKEELEEFMDASNTVDVVDAVLDLIYVSIGTLHKIGLTPSQMVEGLQIVQDANKQKSNNKDENGKIQKPEDFIPPEDKLQHIVDKI